MRREDFLNNTLRRRRLSLLSAGLYRASSMRSTGTRGCTRNGGWA